MITETETRSDRISLRVTPDAKALLSSAASIRRRSVSAFVLDTALAEAEETLADRHQFDLSADQWTAFHEALDAPPRKMARMKKLLNEPGAFD